MKKTATVTFSDDPNDYEIGDTITVHLNNGETALFELTTIAPADEADSK